jgi:hypothetical protein
MSQQAKLMEEHRAGTFILRLVVVLAAVVAVVLLVKRAIAPEQQLQAMLDAEAQALNRGDWQTFQGLQDSEDPGFRRYQKSWFDSFLSARSRGEPVTVPSLHVVEVGRRGDQAWALVMEDPDAGSASGPLTGPARIEFFRRVYGQWLHTGPDPDHWGPPQESQTGQITWRYREADAGQVARLAPFAEALQQQIGHDVGLDAGDEALGINLCYSMECGYVLFPQGGEIELPTPLLVGYDEEGLEFTLANLLASHLVNRAAGFDHQALSDSPILSGIKRWEVIQVTGGAPDADEFPALRQAVAGGTLLSLEELDGPPDPDHIALASDQAYTLVEYTLAQYGRAVLPALVQAAGQVHYLGPATRETLQAALGPDLDLVAFEAGWLAYLRERYGD